MQILNTVAQGTRVRAEVAENGVQRKLFGPKGKKVTGDRRKLCREKLHDIFLLTDIVRVM
jgi:hypothetical protein